MRRFFVPLILVLLLFAALVLFLDQFPPIVWDEGWTATVARNWVERGFYGMYLNGEPAPPSQSAAFPSVLSIAAAFQFFGIGFWQARFVSVMYMMGAFAGLYALARSLYNSRVAVLSLLLLVPFAAMVHMQALYIGRNILAEPPMLFFLLMGFLFYSKAVQAKKTTATAVSVLAAILMWSLALVSKAQPLPFWIVSLLFGGIYCMYVRRWRAASLTFVMMIASLGMMRAWAFGMELFLGEHTLPSPPVPGLVNLLTIAPYLDVRINTLFTFLLTGLLLFFGLVVATQKWPRDNVREDFSEHITGLVVLVFVWSWLFWFLLLSIGWERYLFPASFVGSIFVALLFDRYVIPFFQRARTPRPRYSFARYAIAVSTIAVSVFYLILTAWQIVPQIQFTSYARDTTAWLNENVPRAALIETYEMEILFGLDARAHYPPDVVNVEMNYQREIDPTRALSYDPRAVNADYVVVGYVANRFHLYDELLRDSRYSPIMRIGSYTIYQNSTKNNSAQSVSTP